MSDRETLKVYDAQAHEYAALTESEARNTQLMAFIQRLPTKAHVLDLGCGPGHCAATMAQAGMIVTATDASAEMVTLANAHEGVCARQATFDDLVEHATYDAIWANFSLLHAPRADMPRYLAACVRALKPNGVFHIGLKLGDGEARDALGRFYTYYSQDELLGLLQMAGLTVINIQTGRTKGLDGTMADWIIVTSHG
nr:methyltransferase domain-containing protein [uncultured Shimia sp.]